MSKYTRPILTLLVCWYFIHYALTYTEWHSIDSINLIFHEAGHSIFFFMGMFIKIAAGSAFQIILPALISAYFFFKKQYVSASVCLLWVGQNTLNVSVYAGDAIQMQLNLLGGDSVVHDWNYLLTESGMLSSTYTIANVLYVVGIIAICIGVALAMFFAFKPQVQTIK